MFFPPLCLEAVGFFYHKAPFVSRVKNAFEGDRIPISSIFTLSTRRVNEFLNPDVRLLDHGPRLLPGYLRPGTILIQMEGPAWRTVPLSVSYTIVEDREQ